MTFNVSDIYVILLSVTINANSFLGTISTIEYDLFRGLLTLPMYFVNAGNLHEANRPSTELLPPENHVMGYIANDHYRLLISKYTLYTFTVLAFITLLWCVVICAYFWFRGRITPNTSAYPEVDFATKCKEGEHGMADLLKGLGNANNINIEKRMSGKRVFVSGVKGVDENNNDDNAMIVLTTSNTGDELQMKRKYL